VQTTLLGIAIAIILALVTALVGPSVVDWGRYRDTFEAKATRLTGLEVRFAGPIEVHILPTPSVQLQGIEVRRPGELTRTRARSLRIEFALPLRENGEPRVARTLISSVQLNQPIPRRSGSIRERTHRVGHHPRADRLCNLDFSQGTGRTEQRTR
jgi:hypothetical protein